MVTCKLFSLLIHLKLLLFLNLVFSRLTLKLKFSIYLFILVQTVFMFKAQNFLYIIVSKLFILYFFELKFFYKVKSKKITFFFQLTANSL